jgi:hypothetical protein
LQVSRGSPSQQDESDAGGGGGGRAQGSHKFTGRDDV